MHESTKQVTCPFCYLVAKGQNYSLPKDGSGVIYQGNKFVIVPDIAPLALHHLLIISCEHIYALATLPQKEREEINQLKRRIRRFHQQVSKLNTLFFEHGSCSGYSGTACIAHAHLHAVPLSLQHLTKILQESLSLLGEPGKSSIKSDYLYAEFAEDSELYWEDNLKKRQFFRILTANALGNLNRAKWQNCRQGHELSISRELVGACVKSWNTFSVH